jgi:4-hydroxy-4-methyl-2-oxoglutarate aldolase
MLPSVGFPVFSLGACIRGTIKDPTKPAAAGIGVTVSIGDIDIKSGDLIVGDIDGVAAVPAALASDIVTHGVQREEHESDVIAQLQSGATTLDIYDLP